jgi:glycerol-3-phosphate dehydrogenase
MRLRAVASSALPGSGSDDAGGPGYPVSGSLPFTVTPRKGQFAVFRPKVDLPPPSSSSSSSSPGVGVDWQAPSLIIEPVPTERTKGVILWQTVYGTVIVGPTATDQECKHDRSTDSVTLQELVDHGRRVVPALRHWEVIGSYSGLRPSTEHRYENLACQAQ